jgi:hypothetical protein
MGSNQFSLGTLFWAIFAASILAWLAIHPLVAVGVMVGLLLLPGTLMLTGVVKQAIVAANRRRRQQP